MAPLATEFQFGAGDQRSAERPEHIEWRFRQIERRLEEISLCCSLADLRLVDQRMTEIVDNFVRRMTVRMAIYVAVYTAVNSLLLVLILGR